MASSTDNVIGASAPTVTDCVELGLWTPIPRPSFRLKLKDVDEAASKAIKDTAVLTFHAVGCTGCHSDQQYTGRVAAAMATQVRHPHRFGGTPDATPAAFLYHLGDVVYKKDKDTAVDPPLSADEEARVDFAELYNRQFYAPYAAYTPPIFAIAGNHDGKHPEKSARKSAIHHFLKNFCGLDDGESTDNSSSSRKPMNQPYPYWLLQTPLAYFVGLYTNVNNGGQLDDPQGDAQPQYEWLVATLKDIKKAGDRRAVFLMAHYPAYSAAVTFLERGNPNKGPTPRPPGKSLEPIGVLLQRAFRESDQFPDAVFSAHAHLYQCLTCTYADGRQIPFLIAGGGGHSPVEKLWTPCLKKDRTGVKPSAQPHVVFPDGLKPPEGGKVSLHAFDDENFGFLRITLDGKKRRMTGEYFSVIDASPPSDPSAAVKDSFTLDLATHMVLRPT